MAGQIAAFLGVSAIVIVTPGPDTALTIRNSLLGGRRAGVFTAIGVSSGQATWTLATAAGIAALLAASEPAFVAVKLLGAAYLIWLGARSLVAAIRGRARDRPEPATRGSLAPRLAFRQGLLSNLGNPKMAAFFPSLLVQFVPEHAFSALLGLGLVFSLPSPPTARRLFPTAGRTATNGRGLKCEAAGLRALKRAWERASRDERKQLLAQMIHSR